MWIYGIKGRKKKRREKERKKKNERMAFGKKGQPCQNMTADPLPVLCYS